MADNQTKVSNSYLSSNPDFDVADDLVGTKRYQQVKLIDSTSGSTTPIGTAANPMHVQGTAVGGDVNIAEYGGVATSLGQKAEASSIPTVLATEQDFVKPQTVNSGPYAGIGTYDGFNELWYAFPCDQVGTPFLKVAQDAGGNYVFLLTRNTTPSSGDEAQVTRSIIYGINGTTPTKVNVDSSGDVQTDVLSLPFATLTAATVPARGKIVGTSLTGSYATLLTMSGNAKALTIMNSTDQNVFVSFDGGTTDNIELDAYESWTQDYAALGTYLTSGTIQAKHGGTLPKVGSIRAWVVR